MILVKWQKLKNTINKGAKNDDIGEVTKTEKLNWNPVITINKEAKNDDDDDELYWWCDKKVKTNLHFCSFSYWVITINEGAKNDDDDDK